MLLKDMNLDELRNEYNNLGMILKKDISNWPAQTKNGMIGKKREAEVKMKQLLGHLVDKILKNSTVTVMPRSLGKQNINEVVERAKTDTSMVVINYMFPENDLIDKTFKDRNVFPFNVPSINAMETLLSVIYREIGLPSMPFLPKDNSKTKVYQNKSEAVQALELMMDASHNKENFKSNYFKHLFMTHILNNPQLNSYNLVIFDVPDQYVSKFDFGQESKVMSVFPLTETTNQSLEVDESAKATKKTSKKVKNDV